MAKSVLINGYYFTPCKPDIWAMQKHAENIRKGTTNLYAVYKDASEAKWSAYFQCELFKAYMNGHSGSVISGNTFHFTYGFYFPLLDEETGEVIKEYFCKITPNHYYIWGGLNQWKLTQHNSSF